MRVALIIEYDGARYKGVQLQANAVTVQGELERALERLSGEKTRLVAASRTDSGVHAKGQVVSFKTAAHFSVSTWVKALNFYLPPDIAVKAAYPVEESFNVRRQAVSREYRYYILNSPVRSPLWRRCAYSVPHPLSIEAMNQACQAIVGEHDFAPFTPPGGKLMNTRRTVYKAKVSRKNSLVVFQIIANSFLPHQVRHTVGGLIRVGLGKMGVDSFVELAMSRKRGAIGPAAPAYALCLTRVNYADFPSSPQEQQDEDL